MNKILTWNSSTEFKKNMEIKKILIRQIKAMEENLTSSKCTTQEEIQKLIIQLRVSVLVLMVADLENFLKKVANEYLQKVFNSCNFNLLKKLPKESKINSCQLLSNAIDVMTLRKFPDDLKEVRRELLKSLVHIFKKSFDFEFITGLKSANYHNIEQLFNRKCSPPTSNSRSEALQRYSKVISK